MVSLAITSPFSDEKNASPLLLQMQEVRTFNLGHTELGLHGFAMPSLP